MPSPNLLLLGKLTRDTLINTQGQIYIDQPGGPLLYAAAGARVWGARPGLVARVGASYPRDWLPGFERAGLDVQGIKYSPEDFDQRFFVAYREVERGHYDQPVRHFGERGQALPKSLLGYQRPSTGLDSTTTRGPATLRPEDLPEAYSGAELAHFCELDYISHTTLPPLLRGHGVKSVSLEAGTGYMHPDFWNRVPILINGLRAFIASERQVRALFGGRTADLREITEWLAAFNCDCVVVRRGEHGQHLYIREGSRHYRIPTYPARLRDITGASSAFGGGFAAGLLNSGDFLEAGLYAAVAASLAIEGSGAFYALQASSGLAQSRLEALRSAVKAL